MLKALQIGGLVLLVIGGIIFYPSLGIDAPAPAGSVATGLGTMGAGIVLIFIASILEFIRMRRAPKGAAQPISKIAWVGACIALGSLVFAILPMFTSNPGAGILTLPVGLIGFIVGVIILIFGTL